jgi:hypothetical protein
LIEHFSEPPADGYSPYLSRLAGGLVFRQRYDSTGPVHVGDRGPAEFPRSSAALPQRRVHQPELWRGICQNRFHFGRGWNPIPPAHPWFFQIPEHRLVEQLVLNRELLETLQGHSVVVLRAVREPSTCLTQVFVDLQWRQRSEVARVVRLAEPFEACPIKRHRGRRPVP